GAVSLAGGGPLESPFGTPFGRSCSRLSLRGGRRHSAANGSTDKRGRQGAAARISSPAASLDRAGLSAHLLGALRCFVLSGRAARPSLPRHSSRDDGCGRRGRSGEHTSELQSREKLL